MERTGTNCSSERICPGREAGSISRQLHKKGRSDAALFRGQSNKLVRHRASVNPNHCFSDELLLLAGFFGLPDPIVRGELGEDLHGCFLKDYSPSNW